MHAGGRVLAHGPATVSVTGPRLTWPRRAAYGTVLLLGATGSGLWLWLPLHAATHATAAGVPPLMAYGPALAVTFPLLGETGSMLAWTRATASPVTVRHLRSQGGIWWEAGTFVTHEEDPISAGRLVRAALVLADHHHAGLVVVPIGPAMHRAYTRRGFSPGPLHPGVLIRHPHAPA